MMGVLKAVRNKCDSVIETSYSLGQYYGELRKIRSADRQVLISKVHWSNDQQVAFDQYWTKFYGRKISPAWHKLYQSYTGRFDIRYFPEYLYSSKLEPLFDKNPYNDVLEDKSLLYIYESGGVEIPHIFYSRCNGIYRNEDNEIMNRNAFLDELRDLGEVVIKPTVESGSGRGVRFARFKDGVDVYNGDTVNEVIDTYGGSDIAIQECVRPAECLRNIYPYAVNTGPQSIKRTRFLMV